jgi:hypothetical protein
MRPLESDAVDRVRHQVQVVGEFLIDRGGVICWCWNEDRATLERFPSAKTLLSLADRLM